MATAQILTTITIDAPAQEDLLDQVVNTTSTIVTVIYVKMEDGVSTESIRIRANVLQNTPDNTVLKTLTNVPCDRIFVRMALLAPTPTEATLAFALMALKERTAK